MKLNNIYVRILLTRFQLNFVLKKNKINLGPIRSQCERLTMKIIIQV